MIDGKEEIKRLKRLQKEVLRLTEDIDANVSRKTMDAFVEESTIGEIKENMWEMYQIVAEITSLCDESIR